MGALCHLSRQGIHQVTMLCTVHIKCGTHVGKTVNCLRMTCAQKGAKHVV
jgi:hypothetical protein